MKLEDAGLLSHGGNRRGGSNYLFCFISSSSSFHIFSACVFETLRLDVALAFRVVLRV